MRITTLDLLRHGECVDGPCYRGSSDVALSSVGRQQMARSLAYLQRYYPGDKAQEGQDQADCLSSWDGVIASPLQRCALFAERVAQQYALPLAMEPRFQEMDFGAWEGQAIKTVWQTQAAAVQAWSDNPVTSPPPGGEPADIFANRVQAGLFDCLQQYGGQRLLLVTHGGVIRVLLAYCLSMSIQELQRFEIPYACCSRIQVIHSEGQLFYRLLAHNMVPPSDEKEAPSDEKEPFSDEN